MKQKLVLLLLLAPFANAEPVFVGFMSTREDGGLYAVKPSAEKPTQWLKIGGTVDGYAVAEYRTTDETLVLKKEGQVWELKLKAPQVRDGASFVADPAVTDAALRLQELDAARKKLGDAQERLAKLRAEREKLLAERRAAEAK